VTPIEFGYSPPSGDRAGAVGTDAAAFRVELDDCLDLASRHFASIWLPDHVMGGSHFRLEAWTELAWIAARYPGVRIGHVVLDHALRPPALLAKMAATLQLLSGGRFILGYGAGWMESEHHAYGYRFPSARERIDRMDEGIQVIRALWTNAPANYAGTYYRLADAYCEPRPVPLPPIMVGGSGEKRMLRVVAQQADWWNTMTRSPESLRRKLGILDQHCREIGRDPATLRRGIGIIAFLAPTRVEAERLAGSALERLNPPFAGDPAALVDHLRELSELGFDLFQIMFAGLPALAGLRLFIDSVLPEFR
jgi:alkanesulfonate monooxygenase SsuD/methylene tetrahydromethanopterin reductase-like flavin-dependent oxidoreductase (luciferase family)